MYREVTMKVEISGLQQVATGEAEVRAPIDTCMRKARILTEQSKQ